MNGRGFPCCFSAALHDAHITDVQSTFCLSRRIHTSYVNVEPKRRRQAPQQKDEMSSAITTESPASASTSEDNRNIMSATNTKKSSGLALSSIPTSSVVDSKKSTNARESQQGDEEPTTTSITRNSAQYSSGSGSRELRRARILVTVKRTESYERWLEENPTQRQAIIAGTATVTTEDIVRGTSSNNDASIDLPTKVTPPS